MNNRNFSTRCFRVLAAMTLGLAASITGVSVAPAADLSNGADNFLEIWIVLKRVCELQPTVF